MAHALPPLVGFQRDLVAPFFVRESRLTAYFSMYSGLRVNFPAAKASHQRSGTTFVALRCELFITLLYW